MHVYTVTVVFLLLDYVTFLFWLQTTYVATLSNILNAGIWILTRFFYAVHDIIMGKLVVGLRERF